jgi:TolA-binding protein
MKVLAILFVITAVFLCPGCKKGEAPPKTNDGSTMDAEREQFYNDVQARLDDLNQKIEELKRKRDQVAGHQQRHYQRQIVKLEKKEVDLRENLEEIKTAGKAAWADLKPRLKSALDDLTQGLGNAISEFKFSKPQSPPSK